MFNGGLAKLGLILRYNKPLEYASGNIIPGKGIAEAAENAEHQKFLPVESNYRVYSYIKVTSFWQLFLCLLTSLGCFCLQAFLLNDGWAPLCQIHILN